MLNPLLLWFLPLALVPLVLHLIVRRRVKTVELPTLRFLLGQSAQQRRRLWIIEVLVMILRTLAVAMLVLALSRPVADRFGFLFGGSGGQDVSIIVDGGAAMSLSSGGTTALERAQTAVRAVLDRLGPGDHVQIVRAGASPQIVASGFARQREALQAAVDGLSTTATHSDLGAAMHEVLATDPRGPRTLYVATDRRRQAWSGLDERAVLASVQPSPRVVVLDVAAEEAPANAGIIGQPPQDPRPVVGLPVQLTATLVNSSPDQPRDALLSLMLDDQQVSQESVTIPAGGRASRTLTVTPSRAGVVHGRFTLSGDAFADDDAYLFCLNVEPKVVVAVAGSAARSGGGKQWSAPFVTAALRAPLTAQRGLEAASRDIAEALEIRTLDTGQLQRDKLDEVDVLILDNARLDDDRARDVRRFVENGGGLLILAGPEVNFDTYRKHVLSDSGVEWADPVGDVADETRFTPIVDRDTAHPVLRVFAEEQANYFQTVRLYRHAPLAPAEERPATRLLILPDGRAAMADAAIGRGRVLVAGFASDPTWSNLPLKPEFVPLMLRSVSYLRRAPRAWVLPQAHPGLPLVVAVTEAWADAAVEAADPSGRPSTLQLTRSGGQAMAALPEAQRRGYYRFTVTPRSGPAGTLELGAAVNIDPRALDLATLDEAAMTQALQPVTPVFVSGAPGEATIDQRLGERRETWRWLIWIMFAVVGVEFMLSTLLPSRDAATHGLRRGGPLRRVTDRGLGLLRRAGLLESMQGVPR